MANPEEREGEEGEVRRRAALFFDIESWIARFLAVCPKSWSVALASFPFLALSSHSVGSPFWLGLPSFLALSLSFFLSRGKITVGGGDERVFFVLLCCQFLSGWFTVPAG